MVDVPEELKKNLPNVIALGVLVIILLFVLVNFGYMRPCDISGFENIYYAIKGQPRVAIVTDTSVGALGVGDPEALRSLIARETGQFPEQLPAEFITSSNVLDNYQMVIVERSKTMSTQTLRAFQSYVQKGGRLVWIGDAGTLLGPNDFVCQSVTFTYRPAALVPNESGGLVESCGDWQTVTPDTHSDLGGGLCAKTFGGVVTEYVKQNNTLSQQINGSGKFKLCSSEQKPFDVQGATQLDNCINVLTQKGLAITAANVDKECPVYNYWNRGVSRSATGEKIPAIDFSQTTLGFDFVTNVPASNLYFQPIDREHILAKGYDFTIAYVGTGNITLVDTSRFASLPRTSTIMQLRTQDKVNNVNTWPAILVSNPTLQVNQRGLVVYYAFPIDDLAQTNQGGLRFINNLFKFAICK